MESTTKPATGEPLLEVKDLVTSFDTEMGRVRAVDGVSFTVKGGKTLGIVGESGCGKSVTCLSIMRLLPRPAGQIDGGEILFRGKDIVKMPKDEIHKIRGNKISMIFQEPMTALNPVHKIGKQLAETFKLHQATLSQQEILDSCVEVLKKVGIPAPERRLDEFPHQLSGGMRQRVVIAIALACKPDILIADEPTTALDVTIQAQILDLMQELQEETGMAIIFVTHDLGVIAELCDDVIVMYGGRGVEEADVFQIFQNPRHPYTRGLLTSIPRLSDRPKSQLATIAGMVPSLAEMPEGCRFQNRCPLVSDVCKETPPPQSQIATAHQVRCYNHQKAEG